VSAEDNPPLGIALGLQFPAELVDAIADAVATRLRSHAIARPVSPYLDVDETAAYLRASKQRVYDLVHSGALTPRRDGRRLLFHRVDDLDAYLDGREITHRRRTVEAEGRAAA
jgi:excisionase family DNA binding protein